VKFAKFVEFQVGSKFLQNATNSLCLCWVQSGWRACPPADKAHVLVTFFQLCSKIQRIRAGINHKHAQVPSKKLQQLKAKRSPELLFFAPMYPQAGIDKAMTATKPTTSKSTIFFFAGPCIERWAQTCIANSIMINTAAHVDKHSTLFTRSRLPFLRIILGLSSVLCSPSVYFDCSSSMAIDG